MNSLMMIGTAVAFLGVGCSSTASQEPDPVAIASPSGEASAASTTEAEPLARSVDPREGGFEVGFGEFAVTLEAPAIRPGPVTFVVRNGGELVHGFEIENDSEEGDSSGSGSGEDVFKFETNTIQPGETIRFELDLRPGTHKVECFVANHDDLGMEILLEVRADAPKVRQDVAPADGDAVSIRGFAFEPSDIEVAAGTEITWTNEDPTPHTVTAEGGAFDSGTLESGATFSTAIDGSITYLCEIHPTMEGSITVV